jgi:hypothetical protein
MTKILEKNIIRVVADIKTHRGAVKCESGLAVKHVAVAIFDTAGKDSAGVSNKTVAAHGTGVYLPIGAIVTDAWFDVKTTFTSAGADAGTIATSVVGAGDINAAIAISDASNVWDAGLHGSVAGTQALDGNALTSIASAAANAATMIKCTAEKEITVTVATQALTAGKMAIFVEYFIGL